MGKQEKHLMAKTSGMSFSSPKVIILLVVIPLTLGLECQINNTTCVFKLRVEPRLTMMNNAERVLPFEGGLYYSNDSHQTLLDDNIASKILTADGVDARLVIAINGEFPGPELIMYENQNIEVEVYNMLHTDSTTVHFHGMHQRGTPWSDGVAYVTQCPILPGTRFTYKFRASPAGTHWYHAHIGDQRSMGLYGPFIVKKKKPLPDIIDQHIMILQDWNHNMDPETAYQKMLSGIYDCVDNSTTCLPYVITKSIDGANFSRFEFHSGLVNGKGRFHFNPLNPSQHNGSPLTRYIVQQGSKYRFRVISAATLYPFRVYVVGHRLTIAASDGRELTNFQVDSFIIQSGERYDFILEANQPTTRDYMIIAESIEEGKEKMHVAEAILQYSPTSAGNTESNERGCTQNDPCIIFNCPFRYYPANQYRNCTTYNFATGIEEDNEDDRKRILNTDKPKSIFLNFAFPGVTGNTNGSVNGRQFVSPNVAALTQPKQVGPSCSNKNCGAGKTCSCAYSIDINDGEIVELVLLNKGSGSGWSHPVHIHGHSFYVLSYGFPDYDTSTGTIQAENNKVICQDEYCNVAGWNGSAPVLAKNRIPPLKDTVVVPTGGYVQVRFKADNPGVWFLHCHIDLHNTNGMAMMINESFSKSETIPEGFPQCGDYIINIPSEKPNNLGGKDDGKQTKSSASDCMRTDAVSMLIILSFMSVFM